LTRVHTKNSGNIKFPTVDWSNWQKEIIEEVSIDENNEYNSTYSIWRRE